MNEFLFFKEKRLRQLLYMIIFVCIVLYQVIKLQFSCGLNYSYITYWLLSLSVLLEDLRGGSGLPMLKRK